MIDSTQTLVNQETKPMPQESKSTSIYVPTSTRDQAEKLKSLMQADLNASGMADIRLKLHHAVTKAITEAIERRTGGASNG